MKRSHFLELNPRHVNRKMCADTHQPFNNIRINRRSRQRKRITVKVRTHAHTRMHGPEIKDIILISFCDNVKKYYNENASALDTVNIYSLNFTFRKNV